MNLLDRYILRSFIEPFLICFLGFLAIWLIFDLSDNAPDFIDAKAPLRVVAGFYLTQLPAIVLIVLPVGLLLALLFSLSKMSRTNELIAQLTAGRSVFRILMPLFGVGLICVGVLWWLGQELGPRAEAFKKTALEQIQKGRKKPEKEVLEAHLFRDRVTGRTWYIRKLRIGENSLQDVVIVQQDADANIVSKWYADRADWVETGQWNLLRGVRVDFDTDGNEIARDVFTNEMRTVNDWPETPWRVASANFEPQNLTVPELKNYLSQNRDFPSVSLAPFRTYLEHRQAYPWICLVAVLLAGPFAIVYSRRAILSGIALAVGLFSSIFFLNEFFLVLGKGMHLSPVVAAWTPAVALGIVGWIALFFRNSNRELPQLFAKRR